MPLEVARADVSDPRTPPSTGPDSDPRTPESVTVDPEVEAGFDLALYARLLTRHTRAVDDPAGTRVDYEALDGDADWPLLVEQIRAARPSRLGRPARLAFWINAYNILTIELVRAHRPIDSIRDIGSFFSPVWDLRVATIEGVERSLGSIEHEILRRQGEPRIHAAIVCASTSCPPLARTPFRPDRLDTDLDAAMRRWLASPEKGVAIDRDARVVSLSRIFDWFEEDFETTGGVLETIARHVPAEDAAWLRGPGRRARKRYLDYDWSLNDLAHAADATGAP
ncbi:MAG: DUF547 domain-containing protein [Myxococcota bacterium]